MSEDALSTHHEEWTAVLAHIPQGTAVDSTSGERLNEGANGTLTKHFHEHHNEHHYGHDSRAANFREAPFSSVAGVNSVLLIGVEPPKFSLSTTAIPKHHNEIPIRVYVANTESSRVLA
ncbi:Uu.00g088770.m01.CDS01 [Anthostomella pinea]|uniref:Uu.00g088770.m01.CDS01 n=1 Tax=Anthostomella pinea TaxID=933095 RepID=A0AAI8VNI1_9PEZI|nr:Uu.00g088770.m01.CDS01 [Anthostomella pinea]